MLKIVTTFIKTVETGSTYIFEPVAFKSSYRSRYSSVRPADLQ